MHWVLITSSFFAIIYKKNINISWGLADFLDIQAFQKSQIEEQKSVKSGLVNILSCNVRSLKETLLDIYTGVRRPISSDSTLTAA